MGRRERRMPSSFTSRGHFSCFSPFSRVPSHTHLGLAFSTSSFIHSHFLVVHTHANVVVVNPVLLSRNPGSAFGDASLTIISAPFCAEEGGQDIHKPRCNSYLNHIALSPLRFLPVGRRRRSCGGVGCPHRGVPNQSLLYSPALPSNTTLIRLRNKTGASFFFVVSTLPPARHQAS